MKLQLLIPQFNETDEVMRPMLESIRTQQGVDLNDIEVIIGNDGSDTKLSEKLLGSFSYTVIIETIVSIVANLAVTLIGVFGAWLLMQISKSQQLSNINTAVGELTDAAEQTVLELQQTVVDDLKAASADGKLTQEEINALGKKLLRGTLKKMSDSSIGVLKAANVDINAIVTGAGEALIARMKAGD